MNSKRILIVEDDEEVLEMIKVVVGMCCPDCEVAVASNAVAALGQLQNLNAAQSFDVILTDYNMPVMNGLQLARAVRKSWPETYIVLMSGSFDSSEFQREVDASKIDCYLQKPFGVEQLAEILHRNQKD